MATTDAVSLVSFQPKVEEKVTKMNEIAAKNRAYQKAYRAIRRLTKREGKVLDEKAKALARDAGRDAYRACTDIGGTSSDSTRAWSDIR